MAERFQFSLRSLLLLIAACVPVALVGGRAYQGSEWARGFLIGLLVAALAFGAITLVHVVTSILLGGLASRTPKPAALPPPLPPNPPHAQP